MTSNNAPELKFYDTFSREKRVFTPLDPNNVRMYVCGPTVYDYAHIGNARPAIVFDVLFRLLRHVYGEDKVTYVRNITDVDDKIIDRARRDHEHMDLNEAIRAVTERTADQYQKDVTALGCLEPSIQPRATENILEMQALISSLIKRKHAYIANGEVLFDTKSMKDYGGLSKRNLDEQQAGARVAVEAHKKNPSDFVLWKQSADDEPGWVSPWGRGRPGWHIECSAMSERYLGQEFDIHGGGLDLIFPHHENELAQSRCAHGSEKMANFWMHNGFLQVEGKKMSKSDGNFITIHELLETEKFGGRKWPGEVLRLAMLMTHYREPIDFSVARLEEAEANLNSWLRLIDEFVLSRSQVESYKSILLGSQKPDYDSEEIGHEGNVNLPVIIELLGDDLATPTVVSAMRGIATDIAHAKGKNDVARARSLSWDLLGVLGWLGVVGLEALTSRKQIDVDVDSLIDARLAALNTNDFAKADEIRADLLTKNVQLMDYKDPETGERRTKWEIKS